MKKLELTKKTKCNLAIVLCCIVAAVLFATLASIVMNRVLGPVAPSEPTEAPEVEIHPPVEETPKRWQVEEADTAMEVNGENMLMGRTKFWRLIDVVHDSPKEEIVESPDPEETPIVEEIVVETPVIETTQETLAPAPIQETTPEVTPTYEVETPEPIGISVKEVMDSIQPLRDEDYAAYLAAMPWLSTKPENLWADNENYDLDSPDWLPGLKVSNLTADMFTLPEWCSESTFKHIVNMIGCEGGNSQNDENLCYTGGCLYNRVFHNAYFIGKYGDGNVDFNSAIDNNLNAIGQYNPWYTTDDCYNGRIMTYPAEVRDRIIRVAYLMINGYIDIPEGVVFQAEFSQGSGTWKVVHISNDIGYQATEYYCFTLGVYHE